MPTRVPGTPLPLSSVESAPPTGWQSSLGRLLFAVGLAVVFGLFGLVVWRLIHLPAANHRPVANHESPKPDRTQPPEQIPQLARVPSQILAEKTIGQDESERMAPPSLPPPQTKKRSAEPSRRASIETQPWAPTTWPADQVVEKRLRRNETALRAELHALPEVRLLSDQEVIQFRAEPPKAPDPVLAKLKTAARKREAARGNLDVARTNLRDARKIHRALRSDFSASALEQSAAVEVRQAEAAFALAERDYQVVEIASREAALKKALGPVKNPYSVNLRLHQLFERKAIEAGLVLQMGRDSQLDPSTAQDMATLSRGLRTSGFVTFPARPTPNPFPGSRRRKGGQGTVIIPVSKEARMQALHEWCKKSAVDKKSATVPTLTQMLQIEDEGSRLQMVRELTRIPSSAATSELAIRAIADLSPEVRQAALDALKQRPDAEYVPILLRGMRYPWPPVADHAAFALRTLHPREATASLVEILDLPSPSAPIRDRETNRYTVCEVVRLNHMRNCLLCHAPASGPGDGLVQGFIPVPGKPLPPVEYYESRTGDFVRADITYLRQDFSFTFPALDVTPWPCEQRYDFVTRQRTLPLDSPQSVEKRGDLSNYPQREAVLYALRGITGKDGGDSSAKWRELLGIPAGALNKPFGASLHEIGKPPKDKRDALEKGLFLHKGQEP